MKTSSRVTNIHLTVSHIFSHNKFTLRVSVSDSYNMDIQELEVLDSAINEAFDLSARERVLIRERVLTDFFGEKRVLEPFYLILVDVRLYLVPVKSLQLSLGSSLAQPPPRKIVMHHLAHLDRIKSLRVETRPPKLIIPLVEKILTLLIEIQANNLRISHSEDSVEHSTLQTSIGMETDMLLDLTGLSTDRPASVVATATAVDTAALDSAVTSVAPPTFDATATASKKTVGCCGSRRGADVNAEDVNKSSKPTTVAEPSTRTVKIYLNYFRRSHAESDWAFQQLRDAWSKQVLRRTLECDQDYLLLTTRRATVHLAESDYRLLFEGLVSDLERTVGDAASLSDLLLELFVSLKRYFIVKKLFWETPKLFELLVVTMETVAKEQQRSGEALTEIEKQQHGNQLKVLLHSLQALNCSFEDTEALASRHRSLHQSEGRLIPSLIGALSASVLVTDGRHSWGDVDGDPEVVTEQVAVYRALLVERARTFYHLMAQCSGHSGRQEELNPLSLTRLATAPACKPGFLTFVADCLRHCARHFDYYGRVRAGAPVAEMRPETAVQLFEALDALRRILMVSQDAWNGAHACPELLAEVRHFLRRSRVAACLRRGLPLRDAFLVLADDLRRVLQLHLDDVNTDVGNGSNGRAMKAA